MVDTPRSATQFQHPVHHLELSLQSRPSPDPSLSACWQKSTPKHRLIRITLQGLRPHLPLIDSRHRGGMDRSHRLRNPHRCYRPLLHAIKQARRIRLPVSVNLRIKRAVCHRTGLRMRKIFLHRWNGTRLRTEYRAQVHPRPLRPSL